MLKHFKSPSKALATIMKCAYCPCSTIAFMPTNPNGAWGPLDYKKEERCVLAIKSREAAQRFGTPERQKLIDEIHEYMLSKAPPVPQLSPLECSEEHPGNREGEAEECSQDAGGMPSQEGLPNPAVGERITEEIQKVPADANPSPTVARAYHKRLLPMLIPALQELEHQDRFMLEAQVIIFCRQGQR